MQEAQYCTFRPLISTYAEDTLHNALFSGSTRTRLTIHFGSKIVPFRKFDANSGTMRACGMRAYGACGHGVVGRSAGRQGGRARGRRVGAMEYFISHQTALEFWKAAQASVALEGKRLRKNPPIKPVDGKELHVSNPWNLTTPMHILISNKNVRRVNESLQYHIASRQFPTGSFIQVDSKLAVSSPELCFVQMASELSLIELIELGYEFCGRYRLEENNKKGRGFRDDLPLTSVNKLDSYLSRVAGLKGSKNARRALRYLADGSASPMESALTMLLTLPYKFGGYGLPMPLLNCPVQVAKDAKKTSKAKLYCDLYWPEEQVDVEYDSDAYHANPARISKDAIRRNALTSAGVTVITLSRKQINNTAELHRVAVDLSKLLGKRLVYKMPEFTMRHAKLRSHLLPKVPQERLW